MSIEHRRIYVASSWRNPDQPQIVEILRKAGHEVYDFRNPAPGNNGFAWSEIDRDWLNWDPETFAKLLTSHPVAADGFAHDKKALDWCDTCILVLPCGRSAHLELGYAAGQGKETYVLLHEDKFEPELMYLLNTACATSINAIIDAIRQPPQKSGLLNIQQYSMIHAIEECSEVIKAATKALRFGLDDTNPKTGNTNAEDLREEMGDVMNLSDVLIDCHVIEPIDHAVREDKKDKGRAMAEYSRSKGILT